MAIRFLFVWLLVSSCVYGWFWIASKRQKKATKKQSFRLAVSAGVGLLLVVCMFFINQIQGV